MLLLNVLFIPNRFHGTTPFWGDSTVRIIANITAVEYSFPVPHARVCSQQAMKLMKDIFVKSPRLVDQWHDMY